MNILLGICGGIAAYKTPDLVRRLQDHGHQVRCVLTENASHVVAKDALVAVTSAPVAQAMWPADGSMPHIDLARWAEVVLIAPATANFLAKSAIGLADDLLSTLILATEAAVFVAPAMNTVMWNKPIVQQNLDTLREWQWEVIGPLDGELACGESGAGKMQEPSEIAALVSARLEARKQST